MLASGIALVTFAAPVAAGIAVVTEGAVIVGGVGVEAVGAAGMALGAKPPNPISEACIHTAGLWHAFIQRGIAERRDYDTLTIALTRERDVLQLFFHFVVYFAMRMLFLMGFDI